MHRSDGTSQPPSLASRRELFARFLFAASLSLGVTTFTGCKSNLTIGVKGKGQIASDAEGVACDTPDCTFELENGSVVQLTALAKRGSKFLKWAGPCTVDGARCKLELEDDTQVTAHFVKLHDFEIIIEGGGVVTTEPEGLNCPEKCKGGYPAGAKFTLHAKGTGGFRFERWEEACSGSGPCDVEVKKGGVKVKAVFKRPSGEVVYGVEHKAFGGAGHVSASSSKGHMAFAAVVEDQLEIARIDGEVGEIAMHATFPADEAKTLAPVASVGDNIIAALADANGCQFIRFDKAGGIVWKKRLAGCTDVIDLQAMDEAVIALGASNAEVRADDSVALYNGGQDVLVARLELDDGLLTWVTALGGPGDDSPADFAVANDQTVHVGWHGGEERRGAWLTRVKPDGKAYPGHKLGDDDRVRVRHLAIHDDTVTVVGDLVGRVDFGGGRVGPKRKDTRRRAVIVHLDADYRHVDSRLVSGSMCANSACAYQKKGGLLVANAKKRGLKIARYTRDGVERWSREMKAKGSIRVLHTSTTAGAVVAAAVGGSLKNGDTTVKAPSGSETVVLFRLQNDD